MANTNNTNLPDAAGNGKVRADVVRHKRDAKNPDGSSSDDHLCDPPTNPSAKTRWTCPKCHQFWRSAADPDLLWWRA